QGDFSRISIFTAQVPVFLAVTVQGVVKGAGLKRATQGKRTFSSRGDMSMGTAAAGSNMTFSPSRNGTSLDLQAGLEARVRENITLGVQGGYAHSVSGSSAEGYNGQATLNVTF
ncbi:hypothetical protein, partial [Escherichia coli]|uniref:hypothetical protein n=1 Tax=Escherichia coli TaxID=562 RepID=UPI003D2F24B7